MLWSGIYPTAECILSCKVFRTLLLSEQSSSAIIRTEDVEEMVMAAIDRANEASDPERRCHFIWQKYTLIEIYNRIHGRDVREQDTQ